MTVPRVGEPAPWFHARTAANPRYAFDTVAGRNVLMLFFGQASRPEATAALDLVLGRRRSFDDERLCFFGVTIDPADEGDERLRDRLPGLRFFFDFDRAVSASYGVMGERGDGRLAYEPTWVVLDFTLRVVARLPISRGAEAVALAEGLPPPDQANGTGAPVLLVPRVLEPELCARLIDLYEFRGGEESGFMREIDGRTVGVIDPRHKRRSDHMIEDAGLRQALMTRIARRLRPMIERAFQFDATRMERYVVARYDAAEGGHFRPHRDNTTKGTAHRRFAVTINLNADGYDGGDLRFPEFGRRTYRAPTGGAVVFSCSLLHEVTPVTRGRRYAFLPFLYDEAAAAVREANNRYLDGGIGLYAASPSAEPQTP